MSWHTVRMPLMFMLSMSLIGLEFYPALLIAFGLVIYCLKNDRQYDAVIMTIFLYGGYNFYKMNKGIRQKAGGCAGCLLPQRRADGGKG